MKESENKTKQLVRAIKESGGNQKMGIVDNRIDSISQRSLISTMQKSHTNCIQLEAIAGGGILLGDVTYTKRVNSGALSAWKMEATNIRHAPRMLGFAQGNSPVDEGNPPRWDDFNHRSYYRMHLLNAELGGTGSNCKNLAPGRSGLNRQHSTIENRLKDYITGGNRILTYDIEIAYKNLPGDYKRFSIRDLTYNYSISDGTTVGNTTLTDTNDT